MIVFLGVNSYREAFVLVVLIIFFALSFCICDCANKHNLNVHKTITPISSIFKLQLSSPLLPDNKVTNLDSELTPETALLNCWKATVAKLK